MKCEAWRWLAVVGMASAIWLSACVHVPPSRRAGPRREAYLQSHRELRPAVAEAIAKGHVVLGMDREQVRVVLGEPAKTSVFPTSGRLAEVWIYPAAKLHQDQLHAHGRTLFRLLLIDGTLAIVEPI